MQRLVLFSRYLRLQTLLATALGNDYEVSVQSNPAALREYLKEKACDLLLLDIDTTFSSPESYIALFNDVVRGDLAIVLLVDHASRPTAIELMDLGAHSYCQKPPALRELKAVLLRAYQHLSMVRALKVDRQSKASKTRKCLDTCDSLIGSTPVMRGLYDLIYRVTGVNASVLITGESGTGKELISRAIHNLGPNQRGPFIAVSCSAIPETLIESELFGHEKGAFTGAVSTRIGYFEQAAGGTLFLDEIGELSPQVQVKLLRVLQQREFTRLGGVQQIALRARLVVATNRDLGRLVEQGVFRADLYYRLKVMEIHSPALVERVEDIPILARHFLEQYREVYGKYVGGIAPEAMLALQQYQWPGNVRELENTIQRAIICTDGMEIGLNDLPPEVYSSQPGQNEDSRAGSTFDSLLRSYKIRIAVQAIEDCRGNKTLAARHLDISRAYLHRLIRDSETVEPSSAA